MRGITGYDDSHRSLHRRRLFRESGAGWLGRIAACRTARKGIVRRRSADDQQSHGDDSGDPRSRHIAQAIRNHGSYGLALPAGRRNEMVEALEGEWLEDVRQE